MGIPKFLGFQPWLGRPTAGLQAVGGLVQSGLESLKLWKIWNAHVLFWNAIRMLWKACIKWKVLEK